MERNTFNTTMTFAIGIPTLNRYDLLKESLEKYLIDFPNIEIYVLDNGNQGIDVNGINVINSPKNLGVGASWNYLCYKIFKKHEFALILNDDIYLGKKTDDIEKLIKKNSFLVATPDWCSFIIPKYIYEKVGKFDEIFYPAYYEDNSYAYRLKLNGLKHTKTPDLNPIIYRNSQTGEKDKSIFDIRLKNKQIYIEMWGGLPEREKFTKPYNKN